LKNLLGDKFSVATSTIGAISYYSDATVIDMLGLTDRHIARHPEDIPGIVSPWKERRYNTRYLLSREPDVILFSTGMKPSAPAEKALFMNSQFRLDYYPYYIPREKILWVIFRQKETGKSENRVSPDVRFVDLFSQALSLELKGNYQSAAATMQEVIRLGPPDFALAYDQMAYLQYFLGNRDEAKKYASRAIALDEYCLLSHFLLHEISLVEGDNRAAKREELYLVQRNPELLQMSRKKSF
jgi:tetratricopeptide (TPR) repeat protein